MVGAPIISIPIIIMALVVVIIVIKYRKDLRDKGKVSRYGEFSALIALIGFCLLIVSLFFGSGGNFEACNIILFFSFISGATAIIFGRDSYRKEAKNGCAIIGLVLGVFIIIFVGLILYSYLMIVPL